MESLYLLIPLSVGAVLVIIGIFAWALNGGQFEDLEREGQRILTEEGVPVDGDQKVAQGGRQESLVDPDQSEE